MKQKYDKVDESIIKILRFLGMLPPLIEPELKVTNEEPDSFNVDFLKKGIEKWNKGNTESLPIMDNLDTMVKAGKKVKEKGFDPIVPTWLALRETQGGRDLLKRDYGRNNAYNINYSILDDNNQKKRIWVDYPNWDLATMGGVDPEGVERQGLAGTIMGPYYKKYHTTNDIADFLRTYSPPEDGNGPIERGLPRSQLDEYDFFKNLFYEQ